MTNDELEVKRIADEAARAAKSAKRRPRKKRGRFTTKKSKPAIIQNNYNQTAAIDAVAADATSSIVDSPLPRMRLTTQFHAGGLQEIEADLVVSSTSASASTPDSCLSQRLGSHDDSEASCSSSFEPIGRASRSTVDSATSDAMADASPAADPSKEFPTDGCDVKVKEEEEDDDDDDVIFLDWNIPESAKERRTSSSKSVELLNIESEIIDLDNFIMGT